MIDAIDQVPFQAPAEKVISILGEPLTKRGAGDLDYWQYETTSTTQATWVVLKNGSVFKIVQPGNEDLTLQMIIAQNGYPEYSGRKTDPGQIVNRTSSVQYYPQLGKAFFFTGDDLGSSLSRTEQVDHLTSEDFLSTLSGNYESYELPHTITVQETPSPPTSVLSKTPTLPPVWGILGIIVVGVIVITLIVLLGKKMRSPKKALPSPLTGAAKLPNPASFSTQAEIYPGATSPNDPSGTAPVLRITNND